LQLNIDHLPHLLSNVILRNVLYNEYNSVMINSIFNC